MKVLHVDSASEWRGGQNQVWLTARGMARRGHEVAVACRRGGALERRLLAQGLPTHGLGFGGGDLDPRPALGLARLIREHRPDVLQLHDPHAIAAGLLADGLSPGRRRIVATRRVDFRLRGPLSRLKYTNCGRIVAVSRAIAGLLEQDGVPAARVRVVYEGVPDRAPLDGGDGLLQQLGIPAGAPLVGNVAALTDHKDHPTLLAAAARVLAELPDVHFLLVGEGERRASLEAQARALGLAARVVFAGFRDDLDRLLPRFDVFCLSSHSEGLGTSLLDAMCFRRPIVATAAGGIPEAVEDGVSGRVVPVGDAEALAQALVSVLREPPLGRRLGDAGRERFERLFLDDRMVEQTLAVYAELA